MKHFLQKIVIDKWPQGRQRVKNINYSLILCCLICMPYQHFMLFVKKLYCGQPKLFILQHSTDVGLFSGSKYTKTITACWLCAHILPTKQNAHATLHVKLKIWHRVVVRGQQLYVVTNHKYIVTKAKVEWRLIGGPEKSSLSFSHIFCEQ